MQCPWIENYLSIETDGWTRACCLENSAEARISHVSEGIRAAFNHSKLLNLRKDLEEGYSESTRNFCHRCEKLENKQQPSLRTTTPILSDRRELKMLQFKMSNRCQLQCAHCGPSQSSTWAKQLNIQPHVQQSFKITDHFLEELGELLPQLVIIKFTGGEPFLDPGHWKILEYLAQFDRSHCTLQYITNGLVKPRRELWAGWKSVDCSVSADGYQQSFEWFRRGAEWEELVDSVHSLSAHARITVNFSITPYTMQDYVKAKEFWPFHFFGFPIVVPNHASLFEFPKSIVQQIPDYEMIPGHQSSAEGPGRLEIYTEWARKWDVMHSTPGWAEKLFWWIK